MNTPTHTTHSNSSQQSLRHIRHDDANEEDDSLQPGVTKDEWQDEETHAEEDSHTSDDVDEMFNLNVDGRTSDLKFWRQRGDSTHYCSITSGDDDATGCAWEEGWFTVTGWIKESVNRLYHACLLLTND